MHENFHGRKILRKLFKCVKAVPMSNLQNEVLTKFFIFKLTHCLKSAGAFCLKVVAREMGGTTAMLNKKYLLEGSVHTMRKKGGQQNCYCWLQEWDTGDRGYFFAVVFSSTYFRFRQLEKDKLLGDIHVIRRCPPNNYIYLIVRLINGAPIPPAPLVIAHRKRKNPQNLI
jgi:hypothetical protein